MIESVRVSEKAKVQLITLKRRTGIQNWNVLCRWALCASLKEKSEPPVEQLGSDSSIEMTWKTFAGAQESVFLALIVQRAERVGLEVSRAELNRYFKLHLHRGISYLAGNPKIQSVGDLIRLAG
jgi:DNA sulfur modification protein DndE